VQSKPSNVRSRYHAAWTLFIFGGETATAIAVLDRAVTLNPNAAMAWVAKGWVHAFRNQPDAAIAAIDRGLRLSPFDPLGHYFAGGFAVAHMTAKRFEQAIEWADRALHDQPHYNVALRVKVVANAHLGRLDEASASLGRLLAISLGLTIAAVRARFVLSHAPEVLELYLTGLRLAGLPEA
jgi:tetratricopeptide (TPR) repeat protein